MGFFVYRYITNKIKHMAKSKEFEAKYKAEGLRRSHIRKEERIAERKRKLYQYGKSSDGRCPECGGQMTWCSGCQVWSRTCCEKYGTCMCN
jgi:hypothetical protein